MDSEKICNMDALLFALSLEVVLLQMHILEGTTELRCKQWQVFTKCQKLQREKLKRDRNTVKDVVRGTLIEITMNCEWRTLQRAIVILKRQAELAVSKRLQYEQLLRLRHDVVEELEAKRRQWAVNIRNAAYRAAIIRDKINDDQLNANAKLAYADKWIVARAESLDMQYDQPRQPLPRVDHEDRVHRELLIAFDMQIQEREQSLEYWEKRYTIDIRDISCRLAAKQEQLKEATARRNELQALFNLHEGEIRAWLTFKRERAARLAREERLRASATRIQAWWRGVMVRRALGQYKYLRNVKKPANKNKKK